MATAALALASLGVTATSRLAWIGSPAGERLTLVEDLVLLALAFVAVRRARRRWAVPAAGGPGLAVVASLLRFGEPAWTTTAIAGLGVWAFAAGAVVGWSYYLRALQDRRARAAELARHEQQRALAHDLHDFVAHDVSEMLALSQAGPLVAEDAQRAAALFAQIEQAGQHAMATLDRTVHLLRTGAEPSAVRHEVADIAELVRRFETLTAQLHIDPELVVGRNEADLAYRVVAEALTNVRRHAPSARTVEVSLTGGPRCVEIRIDNDGVGPTSRAPRPAGGAGLTTLAELVAAFGGTFQAGAAEPGWRLHATLPAGAP